jgi:hypothetical protein
VALHQRPGGPSTEDEQRLLAAWHDSFAIDGRGGH